MAVGLALAGGVSTGCDEELRVGHVPVDGAPDAPTDAGAPDGAPVDATGDAVPIDAVPTDAI